jgi:hypothetical protein
MRFSPLCLLAVLSLSLPSARVFAADKWTRATSPHFDMYADESETEIRAALQHLEAVRGFFINATHSQDPDAQPVRIVAFHSEGDFNRYKPAEYVVAGAYPLPGQPATIVALGLKPDSYEKIFMEYCQMVLDRSAPQLPYWIRAGLAQFYSTLKPGDGTIKLGAQPTRSFHSTAAGGLDITLLAGVDRKAYLESRSKAANDYYTDTNNNDALGKAGAKSTTALNATQANITQDYQNATFMLTHMIMFNPAYRAKAGQLIGTLASGQDTAAAFNAVYGRSLSQVLDDLLLYMRQSALPVSNPKYVYDKPPAPQIQAMTKEDQDRVIADLGKKAK